MPRLRAFVLFALLGVALSPILAGAGRPPIDPRMLPEPDGLPAASAPPVVVIPRNARALWVVRDALVSPEGIDALVEDAAAAGTTDLLVQVRGRGDAYYRSRETPPAPLLAAAWERSGRFDPLARVLEKAHRAGLRVHAWINVYYVDGGGRLPDGHVLLQQPEWAARDASGTSMMEMSRARLRREETEGVYLDPGRSEVAAHLLRVVDDLVAHYDIDGIHLDYVRYPGVDVGYTDAMRAGFQGRTGVDPLRLGGRDPSLVREVGPGRMPELERAWRDFRCEQVTALVAGVKQVARARRPWILLSAAVKADADDARIRWGQDWVTWLRRDLVDVVAPMMYSPSAARVERQAFALAEIVPVDRVWAGIAVYNQSVDAAAAKIETCRRAGIRGVSIFSYNSLPAGGKSLLRLHQAR